MDVPQPHVVIVPFPAQGHIKPMLMLAQLLSHANFYITFVNTHHNHNRILKSIDKTDFKSLFPRIHFEVIPDGLPPEHPRSGAQALELLSTIESASAPKFKDLLLSLARGDIPPTCIIADGIMSFPAIDVGEELHIPVVAFRTFNASCTWVYFHFEKLIQQGDIPFQGDEHMDRLVNCIPGFEKLLRRRDLPNICRSFKEGVQHPFLQFFITQTSAMTRASALILNTFDELESPIISKLGSLFPKVYTIGPLHALFNSRTKQSYSSNGSLREEDRTCLTWLDSQPTESVIYVSFGSLVILTRDQLLEFWYGLIHSEKPFLWVIREGLISGEETVVETPAELVVETSKRGCIVDWAPQEEVLAHRAVGGFLTHSGWNSTLESILAGVPMICWPQIADQQVNSRCVSELWKVGVDMKDICDRSTVEKMVRDLMDDKREEIMKSTAENSRMAHESVTEGGSSYCNLEKLIEDIRSMRSTKTSVSQI